jgi:hypothetical protein
MEFKVLAAFIHYIWQLDSPRPWHELQYIGDNTPLYVMAIPVIQEFLPDAKFIHMVRDPRDVVTSTLKMRFGADDPVIAALEWHVALGCWLLAERIVPAERRMECRYEDLCTLPKETMNRLAQFVDHTEAEAMQALADHASPAAKENTGFATVAAAEHHTRLTEPVDASRIGRYKARTVSEADSEDRGDCSIRHAGLWIRTIRLARSSVHLGRPQESAEGNVLRFREKMLKTTSWKMTRGKSENHEILPKINSGRICQNAEVSVWQSRVIVTLQPLWLNSFIEKWIPVRSADATNKQ